MSGDGTNSGKLRGIAIFAGIGTTFVTICFYRDGSYLERDTVLLIRKEIVLIDLLRFALQGLLGTLPAAA